MLAAERQSKIIEMTERKGSVQVEELASELKVSAMTIRRDLVKLQEEGKLERCHGGAVAKQEENYAQKQTSNKNEKEKIAGMCASFVSEGDIIFLDAGTTTYEIAKRIKGIKNTLIVTNDLEIARLLEDGEPELFICGGRVQKSTEVCLADMQQRCWQISNLIWDFSERHLSTMPLKLRHRRLRR